jgi:hypothetical protein
MYRSTLVLYCFIRIGGLFEGGGYLVLVGLGLNRIEMAVRVMEGSVAEVNGVCEVADI